jgi:hypothetical protein
MWSIEMSKERELLKRVRDTLHEVEETHYDLYWDIQSELNQDEQKPVNKESIYIDAVTKLNEQEFVIQELAELLSDVLDAWVTTVYVPENHRLYVKANEYLIGLRDE